LDASHQALPDEQSSTMTPPAHLPPSGGSGDGVTNSRPSLGPAPPGVVTEGVAATSEASEASTSTGATGFPPYVLNTGFLAGLVMAFVCLALAALYLNKFLVDTNTAVTALLATPPTTDIGAHLLRTALNARLVTARLALLSCGVFVGMGFGFLGFALFLVGVRGDSELNARYSSGRLTLTRLAPGVLVILCATLLIGICATRETPFQSSAVVPVPPVSAPVAAVSGQAPDTPGPNNPH
jgi:hypothetical protein